MFKYIKWELINEIKSKILVFAVIVVAYLLVLVLPYDDNILMQFIYLIFGIILCGSAALSFLYGTRRTIDSFKNQTFLLESMVPLSPNKILLAKYILAIFFDLVFSIIFVLGLSTLLSKANINLIKELVQWFFNADFDEKTLLARVFLFMVSTTIAFTSVISLFFIGLKSFFPNGKALKFISYILGVFTLNIIFDMLRDTLLRGDNGDLIYSGVMLLTTVICYFASVWFIENKLEIYN